MNELHELCQGTELLKSLVINLAKKVVPLESEVARLKNKLMRFKKEILEWKSEVMIGELANTLLKRWSSKYAFAGIPHVNIHFLSLDHPTSLINDQRGPDLLQLTSQQVKLLKENLNSFFEPVVVFETITELNCHSYYAAHPDLETLKRQLPGLLLDSRYKKGCDLLWDVLTKFNKLG